MSLKVKDLSFSYGERSVLKEINFSASYGEFVSVLGPNGVGKSTLFRCMLKLLTPTKGNIFIDEIPLTEYSSLQLAHKIAYIPQSHNPIFNFSVLDMVLMGTNASLNRFSAPGKKETELALKLLGRLGILSLKDRGYSQLSGGERQLVLIARAMAQQAKILLMDEPSANLDFGNRIRLMQTIKKLTTEGYLVIQSTHDPDQAYFYSDKILALYQGQIAAFGNPKETICNDLISKLYGVCVEVTSMREDTVRICVPSQVE